MCGITGIIHNFINVEEAKSKISKMINIIGLSDHFLMKSVNKWAKFDSNKKRTIKYVHYE